MTVREIVEKIEAIEMNIMELKKADVPGSCLSEYTLDTTIDYLDEYKDFLLDQKVKIN